LGLLKYTFIYDAMFKKFMTKFIALCRNFTALRSSSNTLKFEEKPLRTAEKMCKHKASL
jgi:hypothetical protein